MFRFETLDIWKDAADYAVEIFQYTETIPNQYRFSLGDQLNRAGLSPSNNIAEGSGSESERDFRNFLNIAVRSVYEVVSALTVAKKKKLISENLYNKLYQDGELLAKRIRAFRKTLRP